MRPSVGPRSRVAGAPGAPGESRSRRARRGGGGRRRGRLSLSKFAPGDPGGCRPCFPQPPGPLCAASPGGPGSGGASAERVWGKVSIVTAAAAAERQLSSGEGGRQPPPRLPKDCSLPLPVSCGGHPRCHLTSCRRRRWAGPQLPRARRTRGQVIVTATVPNDNTNQRGKGRLGWLPLRGAPRAFPGLPGCLPLQPGLRAAPGAVLLPRLVRVDLSRERVSLGLPSW